MVKDIKQVKRFILISEPTKYEIKYKQALDKGSAKAGRTARKCEPPAIPCSKPKPVKACECLLLFFVPLHESESDDGQFHSHAYGNASGYLIEKNFS